MSSSESSSQFQERAVAHEVTASRITANLTNYENHQGDCSRSDCLEIIEVLLIPLCALLALGVLIPAAIALSLIGQVEEYSESPFIVRFLGRDTEVNFETFDADGSWRAAGCSLFASILAIISQFAMYATCGLTCAKHYYHYYKLICSITISLIWCFCNIIFLLLGGIVSIIYFVENNKLWHDQCQEFASFQEVKECDDLYTVSSCQIAGGILAFLSSLLYMVLPCTFIYLVYQKRKERSVPIRSDRSVRSVRSLLSNAPSHRQMNASFQPYLQPVPSHRQMNTPFQPYMQPVTVPLSNMQPPELPSVQPSAPMLSLTQPSDPPSMQTNEPSNPLTSGQPSDSKFQSSDPPTYESTLTDPPSYETALTDSY